MLTGRQLPPPDPWLSLCSLHCSPPPPPDLRAPLLMPPESPGRAQQGRGCTQSGAAHGLSSPTRWLLFHGFHDSVLLWLVSCKWAQCLPRQGSSRLRVWLPGRESPSSRPVAHTGAGEHGRGAPGPLPPGIAVGPGRGTEGLGVRRVHGFPTVGRWAHGCGTWRPVKTSFSSGSFFLGLNLYFFSSCDGPSDSYRSASGSAFLFSLLLSPRVPVRFLADATGNRRGT